MSKPIYGNTAEKVNCLTDSTVVTGLVAQAGYLLNTLEGTNKSSILAQLDNVRHQLMVVAGIGSQYTPFTTGTRSAESRGIGRSIQFKDGKLEVVGTNGT